MTIKKILTEQLTKIKPDKKEFSEMSKIGEEFKKKLQTSLNKNSISAEVFIGGSFAKKTLLKKEKYDIDLFIRFDWKYDNLSKILEPILAKLCNENKMILETIHGSRDYFKVYLEDKKLYLEIIPVTKIKKPSEERNVTDLSYFHVSYVKRKVKNLHDEVLLAKSFFQAQKVYGAETYVRGFSGYAVECLIIYYGSFIKMLKELSKIKLGERKVIDIENQYKKKDSVFLEMNENRLCSPIILVDPTYKERNALAALSQETFENLQKSAREFLAKPSISFFNQKTQEVEKMFKIAKSKKQEFLHFKIWTEKQEGDIAGTKLKKFYDFLSNELKKYFFIQDKNFSYDEKHSADCYFILKSKKEIIRIGPPIKMEKHAKEFKKMHKDYYEKNKILHAKIKINFTAKKLVEDLFKDKNKTLNQMGISKLEVF